LLRRYAYAWLTLLFFGISFVLHWLLGWHAYVEETRQHGQAPHLAAWAVEMGRDTFENWQSEFLQLLWQVVGLAYFLYVGSPSSKETTTGWKPRSTPCWNWWERSAVWLWCARSTTPTCVAAGTRTSITSRPYARV